MHINDEASRFVRQGTSCGHGLQVAAVQLRRVKQEPEDDLQMSQQHAGGQAQKGVSALKGFWETQSVAKPGRH